MTNRANQAIDKLYKDLFDRAVDEGGYNYWIDEMQKDWKASALDEDSTDAEKQAVWDNILAETEREIKSGEEYKKAQIEELVEDKYNQELFRSSTDEAGSQYWVDEGLDKFYDPDNLTNFDPEALAEWGDWLQESINESPEAQLQDMYTEVLGGPAGAEGLQYWLDPSIANPLHSGSEWDYGDDNPQDFGATFDPGSLHCLGVGDPLGDDVSSTGFMGNMTSDQVMESILAHRDEEGNEYNSLSGDPQQFYNTDTHQFDQGTRADTVGANNEFYTEDNILANLGGINTTADFLDTKNTGLEDDAQQTIEDFYTVPNEDGIADQLGAIFTGDTSVYDQNIIDATEEFGDPKNEGNYEAPYPDGGGPVLSDEFRGVMDEDFEEDLPDLTPDDDDDGPVDDGPSDGPGDGGPGDGGPGDGGPGGDYPGWPDYGYGGYDPVGGVRIRKPGRNYKNASGWFSRSGKRLSSNPDLKIAPNNLNPVYM